MIDRFKQKFLEEASDLISDLEVALLELEQSTSMEMIQQVFRVMHTLKGNSSMFGFDSISEITHDLETVYDKIRHEQLVLTTDIINISFHALDHIKELLNTSELSGDIKVRHINLLSALVNFSSGTQSPSDTPAIVLNHGIKTFYISFKPTDAIIRRGINPELLVQDVMQLGKTKVYNRKVKSKKGKAANNIWYEIILCSNVTENEVKDVFIFVDDDAEVIIYELVQTEILDNSEILDYLNKCEESCLDLEHFKKLIDLHTTTSDTSEAEGMVERKAVIGKEQSSSIKVSSEKLDQLMNLVSELVTTQARLSLFAERAGDHELLGIAENVEKLSRQLRDNTFSICLIPIDTLIARFQRLVRDLSRQLGKDIEFKAEGTDTELDKSVVEVLADPIMHILRNSLDHGIETPEVRVKKGKPAKGTLLFKAFYSGTYVIIQIKDDGAGINPEKIKAKAVEKGLISENADLSKQEMIDLLFLPGFSTATEITDVSGRGVGMDVVKKHISAIRGEVKIDSEIDQGTTITIQLPLTLSIIDGLLVSINATHYIIPLTSVDKCYETLRQNITNQFNDLMVLDGQQVPFINLRQFFMNETEGPEIQQVVVVRNDENRVGLILDEIVGEYQAVLKPLGKYYKNIEIVSGATILGDGSIALVLDPNKIVRDYKFLTSKVAI